MYNINLYNLKKINKCWYYRHEISLFCNMIFAYANCGTQKWIQISSVMCVGNLTWPKSMSERLIMLN